MLRYLIFVIDVDSLDLKYSKSVLLKIYSFNEPIAKKDLGKVVKSHQVLDNLLINLEKDGYIHISSNIVGPRVFKISLTDKGRQVAKKLKEAEEVSDSPADQEAEGVIHIDGEEINVALTPEERENSKYLKFLFHFNVLDNHITVEEAVPGKNKRIFNIYIKRNGNGIFRLWCEEDDSYECWHVREAWGYPEVQKMMTQYKGKVKMCQVCGFENPEIALFCMHCGNKL